MKSILIILALSFQPVQAETFQVNLRSVLKNTKAIEPLDFDEKALRSKNALVKMKAAYLRYDWVTCGNLRKPALKIQPQLGGWIWLTAFACEQKALQKDSKRIAQLKASILDFNSSLALLDQGPWAKDLQNEWLKSLQILSAEAKSKKEQLQWTNLMYSRPELLPSSLEQTLLQNLQEPFETVSRNSISSLKPQSVSTEPWWDVARKMDYENVIELLENYFDKNKSPSNEASAGLFLGKAYLWTGRYDKAKKQFAKLIEKFPLTEEGVDAQFRLGLLQLRIGNPVLAIESFNQLIETSREKNPLTTRYWKARALELAGQTEEFKKERDFIIQQYPFTYFGLKLKTEKEEGKLSFENLPTPETRQVWIWPKSAEKPWVRFRNLVKSGWLWEASQEIQMILTLESAPAFQMWAEFLSELKLDSLALRFAQNAQNADDRLTSWSFQKRFMPTPFTTQVLQQSEIHKVESWMIWAIMRQESAFNIRALSTSNAYGLMQLIGPTAQEVAQDLKTDVQIPDELFSPIKNIAFGTRYLAKMKNEFGGHWPLAAAAYNAGPTRLKAWLKLRKDTEGIPQLKSVAWRDEIWIDELPWNETQNYVKAVMRNFILYRYGNQTSWVLPPVFWSELKPQDSTTKRQLIEKKKTAL